MIVLQFAQYFPHSPSPTIVTIIVAKMRLPRNCPKRYGTIKKTGVIAGSPVTPSPATHRQTLSAKGTARNSASMHSVFAARKILFLAPLRSPQFRRGLQRLVVSRSPANTPACYMLNESISLFRQGCEYITGGAQVFDYAGQGLGVALGDRMEQDNGAGMNVFNHILVGKVSPGLIIGIPVAKSHAPEYGLVIALLAHCRVVRE